ncbi:ATPase [soil metagenome]
MAADSLCFTELARGIAVGTPAPDGWSALVEHPLLIIVGLTGVGKSTTLEKLAKTELDYTLLPNRRVLTDQLIIAHMQALDGHPVQLVTDRKLRFNYTRRFRAQFAGGMSHALTQLWIDPTELPANLIFDGLRGADEVTHALHALPQARFVVLHAPDVVRVQRLLGRNDVFDQVAGAAQRGAQSQAINSFADLGLPEATALFTSAEEQQLLTLLAHGSVTADDLRAKLQIVVEERRNYDPSAAIAVLQADAPDRTLVIDTTQNTPAQVTRALVNFMTNQSDAGK